MDPSSFHDLRRSRPIWRSDPANRAMFLRSLRMPGPHRHTAIARTPVEHIGPAGNIRPPSCPHQSQRQPCVRGHAPKSPVDTPITRLNRHVRPSHGADENIDAHQGSPQRNQRARRAQRQTKLARARCIAMKFIASGVAILAPGSPRCRLVLAVLMPVHQGTNIRSIARIPR